MIIYNMNLWCKIEIYRSERAWTNKVWIQNMSKWIVHIYSGCGNAGPAGGHRTGRRLRIAKGLIIVNINMRLAANTTRLISSPGQPAGNTNTTEITDQAWGRRPPVKMSLHTFRAGLRCYSNRAKGRPGWRPGLTNSSVTNGELRQQGDSLF